MESTIAVVPCPYRSRDRPERLRESHKVRTCTAHVALPSGVAWSLPGALIGAVRARGGAEYGR